MPRNHLHFIFKDNQARIDRLPEHSEHWEVTVGEELVLHADDKSHDFTLWVMPLNERSEKPTAQFPLKEGTPGGEDTWCIDVKADQMLTCHVIDTRPPPPPGSERVTVRFRLGVSSKGHEPRGGYGGGTGSTGTLNVHPTLKDSRP